MKMSKRVIKLMFISLLFVLFIQPLTSKASGTEAINNFHSDIVINQDSTMKVTETINVTSTGENIRHGIYREIPTNYTSSKGSNVNVGFTVVSVQQDGKAEPYSISQGLNGKRITIGDKDVILDPGDYTYTIVYTTYRQLNYFQDKDELFWNVTGNGWLFPIAEASATITLPKALDIETSTLGGYTGLMDSKAKNLTYSIDGEGRAVYNTTDVLALSEGLSVFVDFPKGIVAKPSSIDYISYWMQDNLFALCILVGTIISFLIYLLAWMKFGRDPKKSTIIPLYYPPRGLSPEDIRFIFNMGYDNKVLTAAIINMAVIGYIRIDETKVLGRPVYTLTKNGNNTKALTDIEQSIAEGLPSSLVLKGEYNPIMLSIVNNLRTNETKLYTKVYYNSNFIYVVLGVFISIVTVVAAFALLADSISAIAIIPGIVIIVLPFVFGYLLKAPTIEGRKLMDEIEGFKLFLKVTEKDRLNMLNPPQRTPALFEKYLPYALALNVEQKWSEQFSQVFDRMAAQGQSYSPLWYSGAAWSMSNTYGFANSFNNSFSSVISSSSTAPGSSSGGSSASGG
ncbi:MAG TPA: DUF2207 domain-containing protein, partial [Clostridiaceae bacterium]